MPDFYPLCILHGCKAVGLHWPARLEQEEYAAQEAQKWPDFSPAQPRRAKARLASKAAGESKPEAYSSGAHGATNKEHHALCAPPSW